MNSSEQFKKLYMEIVGNLCHGCEPKLWIKKLMLMFN